MVTGIHGNYGGSPYRDLVKLMEFLTSVPYIDLDNAVAVGESFGGYMINWIHGHSLGRKVLMFTPYHYLHCQSE